MKERPLKIKRTETYIRQYMLAMKYYLHTTQDTGADGALHSAQTQRGRPCNTRPDGGAMGWLYCTLRITVIILEWFIFTCFLFYININQLNSKQNSIF